VDTCHAADDGIVFNVDMTGKVDGIGHNDIISKVAVVGYMGVSHQEITISNDGHPDIR
jgi:hypothetical protein